MSRTTFFSVIFILFGSLSHGQICPDCEYTFEPESYQGYWEDPNGVVYQQYDILIPDVIGTWTYFKVIENNVRETIFTRDVHCVASLDGRNRVANESDLKIFPNPVSQELTISNLKLNSILTITDAKGALVSSMKINVQTQIKIDVSTFSKGLYHLHVTNDKERVNKFFIVD